MRFLGFDNDTRIFFSDENPQLKALEALENTYTRDQNIYFALAPKDGNVFSRQTLGAIEELTEASWQIPYSNRVDSITNYQHTYAQDDDLIVESLVEDAENLSDQELAEKKKIVLAEPLLVSSLISPDAKATAVNVNLLLPGNNTHEVPEVVLFARKMMDDFKARHPEIDIYMTGGAAFDYAFGEASEQSMSTLMPIMFLVLLVIVGFSLRSFAGMFSTLLVLVFSVITGLGLAGWYGLAFNPASANAPTIILTLAVADSVHILAIIFHQMRLGQEKFEAIAESLRVNFQPVFLTSFTTAIGFLTMNFSDAPPFRELGNIVATGVAAAYVFSILFLPALIAVLPIRIHRKEGEESSVNCEFIANFIINNRNAVLGGVLVLIVVLTSGLSKIMLHDNFIEYFDKSFDIRQATDFAMDKDLTGFDMIEYSLDSGEEGGINDPKYLATVEDFANWYRSQPQVVHVSAITDTMKRLNKNMNGDKEEFYRLPEKRDLAAQYLLLFELSLPFGLDLNNRINVDKSATRFIVTLKDINTEELKDTDKRARDWLAANAPKSMFAYGTGLSIIWAHISRRNIDSMLGGAFLALVIISGILVIALRDIRIGLLSLLPNLAPAFTAFGIWGFMVGQVGLGLSVVVSMTLGIVVDDTVHFLSKYLRARREYNMDPAAAVHYSFNTVGTAMIVTSVALVAGFMVLTYSGFRMTSEMGLLSAITITMALIMDFTLLPTLLMKMEGAANENTSNDFDDADAVPATADSEG